MEASISTVFNVTNIGQCVLELVSNSLNADATAIAIRIHKEKRKIQVIDNGKGILKEDLETLAEYKTQNNINYCNIQDICNRRKQTLVGIRRLSDALFITSRYYNSSKTYMKVLKVCKNPKLVAIHRRPSPGTTVSIYGYHELSLKKWDSAFMYSLIANIAIANPFVSFSIRDDQKNKIIMTITKLHNPILIFKLLYNKEIQRHSIWYLRSVKNSAARFCIYIGLARVKSTATKNIFLNNKIIHCPLILQVISTTFINTLKSFRREQYRKTPKKEEVFVLLFIWSTEYIFTVENEMKTLILPNVQCLLEKIRSKITKVFIKNIKPISTSGTRNHKNLISSYNNDVNTLKLHRCTLLAQQLSASQKNYTTTRSSTMLAINLQEKSKDNDTVLSVNNGNELFTPTTQAKYINKQIILTLSEWSNWTPPGSNSHNLNTVPYDSRANQFGNSPFQFYKHLDFLPKKLHKLLRGNTKITKTNILNDCNESVLSDKLKFGLQIPDVLPHQEINVRPCKTAKQFRVFTITRDLLEFTSILGRMNNELIVGLLIHDNRRVLLMMDQHAMHERIRYESLLDKYKSQTRNQLFSVKLSTPIALQLSVYNCNLLRSNETTVNRFGIFFQVLDNSVVIIHAVPECLRKNKYDYDESKLKLTIKNLLNELIENIASYDSSNSNLPLTIHNAVAMEACHGAVKFGDPLTMNQCRWLLKFLKKTKAPTRCAHGRPSIIPLLELTDLEKRQKNITQVLNIKSKIKISLLVHYFKKVSNVRV